MRKPIQPGATTGTTSSICDYSYCLPVLLCGDSTTCPWGQVVLPHDGTGKLPASHPAPKLRLTNLRLRTESNRLFAYTKEICYGTPHTIIVCWNCKCITGRRNRG